MGVLDEILRDFHGDIKRAEHLLQLINSFREFGGSCVPPAVFDGSSPWPEALSLMESTQYRRTDLPILSGSLFLYLAGRFEYFIRQVVQEVADEIAYATSRYSDLPETLRTELRNRSLEVAQNPRRYGFDESQANVILASLVENHRDSGAPLTISSNVLSITEANMKDRILAELMKRVGMKDFWKDLGKQAQVKLHLEKTSDGDATQEAQRRLNSLMEERNQIAHPTSATLFPGPDQVLESAKFLRIISQVTLEIAQVHLATFRITI